MPNTYSLQILTMLTIYCATKPAELLGTLQVNINHINGEMHACEENELLFSTFKLPAITRSNNFEELRVRDTY